MESLSHVAPGDPLVIPAATWNEIIDAVRVIRADGPRARGAGATQANLERPALTVRVKASATLPNRAIITLGAALIDPDTDPLEAARGPLFAAAAPVAGDVPAVLLAGLSSGEVGRAVVSGVCVASVVISSAAHDYAAPVAGDVFSLASATSGPFRLLTNPGVGTANCLVALGPEPPATGISGSGTDNRIVRWNGTSAVQDSGVIISDNHQLQVTDPTTGTSLLTLVPASTTSLAHPYLSMNLAVPLSDTLFAHFYLSDAYVGAALPHGHHFRIGYSGLDTSAVAITTSYAVTRGFRSGPTIHVGVDGTLGPGATATGGIITDLGSGSYVGSADDNEFTGANTFAAVTIAGALTSTAAATFTPASASTSPATVKGAASQSAYLLPFRDSANALLGGFDEAGVYRGPADFGEWTSPPPPPPPSPPPPPPPLPPPP